MSPSLTRVRTSSIAPTHAAVTSAAPSSAAVTPAAGRALACLAAAALVTSLAVAPADAASTSGLYGVQDATYDGVYRQSLSILALTTAGRPVPSAALDWLAAQQCADGGFASYRADVSVACDPATEDSNATALAVQAWVASGHTEGVAAATSWLRSIQNSDGGFAYSPGWATEANSTAVVIGAFSAAGIDPTSVTSNTGATPLEALAGLQVTCADGTDAGAFDYSTLDFAGNPKPQPEANALATAQAVPAMLGQGFVVTPVGSPVAAVPTCPGPGAGDEAASAVWGASWLATTIGDNPDGAFVPSSFGPGADYGSTSGAVLSLATTGISPSVATDTTAWLADNVDGWVVDANGADQPAQLAQLTLVALTRGQDPTAFGGTDLVARLEAVGPAADPVPTPAPTPPPSTGDGAEQLPDTGLPVGVLLAGAGTLALAGTGLRRAARRSDHAYGENGPASQT